MKTYLIFGSTEYISAYARARKQAIGEQICNDLYARLKAILGHKRLYQDGPIAIGATRFRSAIKNRQIPNLNELLELAGTLHLYLVMELSRPGYFGTTDSVTFDLDRKSFRPTLIGLMEESYSHPLPGFPLALLREHQQMYLLKVRRKSFHVEWPDLIDYFAASGYELNVYLKEATKASAVKSPKRLSRCNRVDQPV